MIADSIYFKGHPCFKRQWSGLDALKPINVIIGRNNSGKSHFLHLVRALCEPNLVGNEVLDINCRFKARGTLIEDDLRRAFPENTSGGSLTGNHWQNHGQHFVGAQVEWEFLPSGEVSNIKLDKDHRIDGQLPPYFVNPRNIPGVSRSRESAISKVLSPATHELSGKTFRRLLSDRDIQTAPAKASLDLAPNGIGATNIVRRFVLSSDPAYQREIIQEELLHGLNTILGRDARFTEIEPIVHDDKSEQESEVHWEIYLGEDKKGLVPLSNSGSGLKTVLLVLLNLIVVPITESQSPSQYAFAFEELENNLHPAILRRLLKYVEAYALGEDSPIFLTTHSSVALDYFSQSANAQIIHVKHDGESASATTVSAQFDHMAVIKELGSRPSDLLQANGVVWVEGPSDRIYLNRWIQLYTEGRLEEGHDYQCAFYGGALLGRTQFTSWDQANPDLANLFMVNSNIVVVCDGDRSSPRDSYKPRVKRIREEVAKVPRGHIWITKAREIENYIPGRVLSTALEAESLPHPGQFESFFPRERSPKLSYMEKHLKRRIADKIRLSILSTAHMTRKAMEDRFDWDSQMKEIVTRIESWNR